MWHSGVPILSFLSLPSAPVTPEGSLDIEYHLIRVENENRSSTLCCLGFHPIHLCRLPLLKGHLLHEASQGPLPLWGHCTRQLCQSKQGRLQRQVTYCIMNQVEAENSLIPSPWGAASFLHTVGTASNKVLLN